jgi:hypothetical protein
MRHTRKVWYMGTRTSVYLDDDLKAAVKASGVPLAELIRRGLTAEADRGAHIPEKNLVKPGSLPGLPAGEPCPGAVCSAPGCWQRDTARYGLRSLALCTACAAALQGNSHQREKSPAAARLVHRGAT